MKKKILTLILSLTAFSIAINGCTKESGLATQLGITENAYIAETSSGDVVINFDEDGNPVEMIDANGDVIDLTSPDVTVKKDKNGEIVSVVAPNGEEVKVKEKATEENSAEILKKAEEKASVAPTEEEPQKEEPAKKAETDKTGDTKYIDEETDKENQTKEKTETPKVSKEESNKKIDNRSDEAKETEKAPAKETSGEKVTPMDKIMYPRSTREGMCKVYSDTSGAEVIATLVAGVDKEIHVIGQTDTDWYQIKFSKAGKEINGWIPIYSLTDTAPEVKDSPEAPKQGEVTPDPATEQKSEEKKTEEQTQQPTQGITVPADAVRGEDVAGHPAYYVYSVHTSPEHLGQVNAFRSENGVPELTWNSGQEGAAMNRLMELVKAGQPLNHGYGTMIAGAENLGMGQDDYVGSYKQSPGHKAALLTAFYNGDGVHCTTMVSVCVDATIYIPDTGSVQTVTNCYNAMMFFN